MASIIERTNTGFSGRDKQLVRCTVSANKERQRELAASLLDDYITTYFTKEARPQRDSRRRRHSTHQPPTNRDMFRKAQQVYKKDRARLTSAILDDVPVDVGDVRSPVGEVKTAYREMFDGESEADQETLESVREFFSSITSPILMEDIRNTLKAMKSNAAGPDGLRAFPRIG